MRKLTIAEQREREIRLDCKMREILFKAKRIDNGELVEGNIILSKDADEEYKAIIIPSVNSNMFTEDSGNEDLGFENWYKVDPSTICQYTGLTDKNGQKIWENDVVRHYNNPSEPKQFEIGVIYWNEDNVRYERTSQYEHAKFSVLYDCVYEVIGNIFDNPELLNE